MTAHTADEAVSLFEEHHRSVVAVVLDRMLPKVEGAPVLERLRQLSPAVPVVLISGSMPSTPEKPIPADENTRFIAKPFTPTDVLEALKTATDRQKTVTPSGK